MAFDYERDTRAHYQDDGVAEEYHSGFAGRLRWRALTHRVVAYFERRGINRLLRRVAPKSVLDLPCGTGKLAEVLVPTGAVIQAADVSSSMLKIARASYTRAGSSTVSFDVADVTKLPSSWDGNFDLAVCLRLFHRVPDEVKEQGLVELGRVARFVLYSTGIETPYHRLRRHVRGLVFGGDVASLCFESLPDARSRAARLGRVIDETWTLPGLSQERLFLVESSRWRPR